MSIIIGGYDDTFTRPDAVSATSGKSNVGIRVGAALGHGLGRLTSWRAYSERAPESGGIKELREPSEQPGSAGG